MVSHRNAGKLAFFVIAGLPASLLLIGLIGLNLLMQSTQISEAGQRMQADFNAELATRLAHGLEQNVSSGMSPADAVQDFQSLVRSQYEYSEANGYFTCLIGSDLKIAAHPDPTMIGMDMSGAVYQSLSANSSISFKSHLDGGASGAGLLSGEQSGSAKQIVFQVPVNNAPYFVSVHSNQTEFQQGLKRLQTIFSRSAVLIILLLVLAGLAAMVLFDRRYALKLEQVIEESQSKTESLAAVNDVLTNEVIRREEAEEDLREQSQYNRQIFEGASDAIIVIDIEADIIIDANAQAQEMLEYSHEEITKLSPSVIHQTHVDKFYEFANQVMQHGRGWNDQLT